MANNFRNIMLLKGFSNYFNRVIKKFDDLETYIANSSSAVFAQPSEVNFNPNDGVMTELLLNISEGVSESDYLLVVLPGANTIESRWFIIECERTRTNQYKLTLKRDVIADNYDQILESPCYIEKATLNENDPLIFNNEGMAFNQIKKQEVLLQDDSRVPWIVGYISRDYLKDAEEAKTVTGRYNVIQSAAIESSTLPWTFSTSSQIVGVTSGYRLKLSSGSYKRTVSVTYQGHTYSNTYDYTEELELNYNDKGVYTSRSYVNNHPSVTQGTITRYTASSDFNFYADSKGNTIEANKIGDWIFANNLALSSVPNQILKEQTSSEATASELLTYNNKIVKDGTRYYRLKVETIDDPTFDYNEDDYNSLATAFNELLTSWNNGHNNTQPHLARAARKVVMSAVFDGVRITPEAITQEDLTVDIPVQSNRIHLNDAPYDMFAIPYGDIHLKQANIDCNKDGALAIAFYAAAEMGSSVVYDLQLLPYCPCREYISGIKTLNENYGQEGYEYNYIKDTQGNKKSIMIWCNNSSGTFNIDKELTIERPSKNVVKNYDTEDDLAVLLNVNKVGAMYSNIITFTDVKFKTRHITNVNSIILNLPSGEARFDRILSMNQNEKLGRVSIVFLGNSGAEPGTYDNIQTALAYNYSVTEVEYDNSLAEDIKVSDACDMYRLVSPNYNGQFEFSLARNGKVNYLNVDYNYKPFSPYIHLNPDFAGLYGDDWNDARGLICGGDFSLPMITSAWTDYQVSNKNYQNIFDRQIQNMNVSHEIAKQQATISAITGSLTGGISGAASGAVAGMKAGPYGAIAGAVVGGAVGTTTSAAGGAMDLANLAKQQTEEKSFATDMYNYNLQNVQAIPYSLAKTSAFTYNNKIWPMIEVYSSTDVEKEAFRNKLKYNGMTVMRIDTISNYVNFLEKRFIKGQLVRLPTIENDSHMSYSIYEEINKGVYL